MALVWADPFDQYGTNVALMGNAGYSIVNGPAIGSPGRTGAHFLATGGNVHVVRSLDNLATTLGQGVGVCVNALGSSNSVGAGILFLEVTTAVLACSVVIQGDLSLGVYDRNNLLKGSTKPNVLMIGSYAWVEVKAIGNVGGVVNTGSVEVRVNGVTRLIVNGMNLPNQFGYHALGSYANGQSNISWDDYIVWDGTGTKNNDFMGDRRLLACYPNANGAIQDFTAVPAGNAFDRVNDSPPSDTAYIEGAAAGNISEFPKDLLSIASTDIAAVVLWGRLFKSDAGTASGRLGINSAGNVLNSPELFPGTTGAYYTDIIELDPNGNVPWTPTAFDAANIRLTRAS